MTTAQQQQDEELANTEPKLIPKEELKKMIEENSEQTFDPIANAMKRHPGLTPEIAEKMARAFGF
jgi:hypothetical protein